MTTVYMNQCADSCRKRETTIGCRHETMKTAFIFALVIRLPGWCRLLPAFFSVEYHCNFISNLISNLIIPKPTEFCARTHESYELHRLQRHLHNCWVLVSNWLVNKIFSARKCKKSAHLLDDGIQECFFALILALSSVTTCSFWWYRDRNKRCDYCRAMKRL